jgi:hypothetical protein
MMQIFLYFNMNSSNKNSRKREEHSIDIPLHPIEAEEVGRVEEDEKSQKTKNKRISFPARETSLYKKVQIDNPLFNYSNTKQKSKESAENKSLYFQIIDNHTLLPFGTKEGEYQGNVYIGEWQNNKPHGYGLLTYAGGFQRRGLWKNGMFIEDVNGARYQGKWRNNKAHGWGKITYGEDGDTYEGEFKYDKKHGKGTYTFKNGDTYNGDWKDDQMHGHGILKYHDGDTYDGHWKDHNRHGFGKMINSSGNIYYEGMWENHKKHGTGTYTFKNGDTYNGDWKDDQMHGHGILKYQKGDTYDVTATFGVLKKGFKIF